MSKVKVNHLARVMAHKHDEKFMDKYTKVIFTVEELNNGFVAPTVKMGIEEMEKLSKWFERFELVK